MKDIMTSLADEVRRLSGTTEKMGVVAMRDALSAVNSEDTSDATADASKILKPYTAYARGQKVVGSMLTVKQAKPTISISAKGVITAKTEQDSGYIEGGTATQTQQMPVQGDITITPTDANVTITKGAYLTGDIVVLGDPNLKPENIKKGITIFGIIGTAETDGTGGDTGGGGTGTISYSGESQANGENDLICATKTVLGSDIKPHSVVVTGEESSVDGVITRVNNDIATYYDESTGEEKTTSVEIGLHRAANSAVIGIVITVNERTENGNAVSFDGFYDWSFSI